MEKSVDLAKQHGPYYYAHAAKAWEVPEDAKTISGEGLTHTGQGPRRLDGAAATAGDAPDDQSMEGLRQLTGGRGCGLEGLFADAARGGGLIQYRGDEPLKSTPSPTARRRAKSISSSRRASCARAGRRRTGRRGIVIHAGEVQRGQQHGLF